MVIWSDKLSSSSSCSAAPAAPLSSALCSEKQEFRAPSDFQRCACQRCWDGDGGSDGEPRIQSRINPTAPGWSTWIPRCYLLQHWGALSGTCCHTSHPARLHQLPRLRGTGQPFAIPSSTNSLSSSSSTLPPTRSTVPTSECCIPSSSRPKCRWASLPPSAFSTSLQSLLI